MVAEHRHRVVRAAGQVVGDDQAGERGRRRKEEQADEQHGSHLLKESLIGAGTQPTTDQPTTGQPTTGQPTTGQLTTGRSTTGRPTTGRAIRPASSAATAPGPGRRAPPEGLRR
ncbi:hypothetical protein TNCT6_54320 [Streptomyces sp. 6-11-2]|nr:hypothetical protein TNCT6_54320 [Streptomyces sp. 6-11-2]